MESFSLRFARSVVRFRPIFIIVFLAITIFFLFVLKDIRVDTRLGDFVPKRHPFIKVQKKLTEVFGGLNQVSIAIEVKDGEIFNKGTLDKVIRITRDLYLTDGINAGRISSLSARKVKHTTATEEGFRVERMLRDAPATPDGMELLKERIKNNPMVYGRMVSPDFKSTLIQADFESGVSSSYIFGKLKEIAGRESDANTNIYLAGRPILEGWLNFYLPKMLGILFGTIFVIAVILFLTFRSKRGVILPLLDSSIATVWGLGVISLFGLRLDPTVMLVPFLILALGTSHSVHFMKRYYEEMTDKTRQGKDAVINSIDSLFRPGLTSVITDGLAFLSLLLIPLGTIRSMALVAGFGVLFNFPTSFIFTPAILSYQKRPRILEVRKEERHTFVDKIMGNLTYLSTHRLASLAVILIFVGVGMFGIWGINRTVIGDNTPGSSHLYPGSPYNLSEKFINEKFGGTNSYYIFVEGQAEAMIDSDVLKKMESLQGFLKKEVEEVGHAISLVDYVKALNMVMFAGDRRYFIVPENNKTIAEYLFLYDISAFPGDFDPVVSPDYASANIKLDLKDHKSDTIRKVIAKTEQWLNDNPTNPDARFLYAGGDIGILGAVNEIIQKNLITNPIFITLLVFLYVAIAFWSLGAGLLLLLPLIFSILVIFGVFGFTNTTLTVETLPLATLSMGLGINYGLYVVNRMHREADRESSLREVIKRTLATSGKAVFFSGMIVAIGMLVCAFSSIRLQARLGVTLGIALLLNMIGALVLLPAFVFIRKPRFIFSQMKPRLTERSERKSVG